MHIPESFQFRDVGLSRAFAGKRRIPMSTFAERYIDGSIEVVKLKAGMSECKKERNYVNT